MLIPAALWRRWKISVALLVFLLAIAALVVVRNYPCRVLLSELRKAQRIVVRWRGRDAKQIFHKYDYEVPEPLRNACYNILSTNLGLEYFQGYFSVGEMIEIYLFDECNSISGFYCIFQDRPCDVTGPFMKALCDTASKGRQLAREEVADIDNYTLPERRPHFIACLQKSFDFVLPTVDSRVTFGVPGSSRNTAVPAKVLEHPKNAIHTSQREEPR